MIPKTKTFSLGGIEVIALDTRHSRMGVEEATFGPSVLEYGRGEYRDSAEHHLDGYKYTTVDLRQLQPKALLTGLGPERPNPVRLGNWISLEQILREERPITLGKDYSFCMEYSKHPIEEGYLVRCRFLSPRWAKRIYDVDLLPTQSADALEVMKAFWNTAERDPEIEGHFRHLSAGALLKGRPWIDLEDYIRVLYDGEESVNSENWGVVGAFWAEDEGVYRLWKRMTYFPM